MNHLSGEQFATLNDALLKSFDRAELTRLVRVGLGESLEVIAGSGKLAEVTFALIEWAQRHDRLDKLLCAAVQERPQSEEFIFLTQQRGGCAEIADTSVKDQAWIQAAAQVEEPSDYYVARDALIAEIISALEPASAYRLVGLAGLGGTGKTVLAKRVLHLMRDKFPDGVRYAELTTSTPQEIEKFLQSLAADSVTPDEMGRQLDLQSKSAFVRKRLADKRTLIVLNNVGEKKVLDLLTVGGPDSKTLVTSRNQKVLKDARAHVIEIPPYDEKQALNYLRDIIGAERVDAEIEAAHEICRLVGCLPLAITIVASSLNSEAMDFSLAEYRQVLLNEQKRLERLDDWADDNSASINSTFEISYKTVPEKEQPLFASLSLFNGLDFGLEAVAALHAEEPLETKLRVGRLRSLSLVQAKQDGPGDVSQSDTIRTARYQLHPLVKAFARSKLGTDRHTLMRRLADYYIALAESNQSPEGFKRLDQDWLNILGVLRWAYEQQEWSLLARGALSVTHYYLGQMGFLDARGHWTTAREILAWAHEGIDHCESILQRVQILTNAGGFAVRQADYAEGESFLRTALEMLESVDMVTTLEEAMLQRLAIYDFLSRIPVTIDHVAPPEWIERGLAESSSLESVAIKEQRGFLLVQQSAMFLRAGKAHNAIEAAADGLALLPDAPSAGRVNGLMHWGLALQSVATPHESIQKFREALTLAEELGDQARRALLWQNMAWDETRLEQYDQADIHLALAIEIYDRLGDKSNQIGAKINLASNYRRRGDLARASKTLEETIGMARDNGLPLHEASAQSNLADVYLDSQRYNDAWELLKRIQLQLTQMDESSATYLAPTVYRQQAEAALGLGRIEESRELVGRAIAGAQTTEDRDEEGIGWRVLGRIHFYQQALEEAKEAWDKSLALLAESPYELAKTRQAMAEAGL